MMSNGFRRTLCCLLIVLLLAVTTLPAYAATTGKNGLFSYTMRGNGTLTITKFDWSGYQQNTNIVIPQMIDGYTVTAIGELAFSQGDIDMEKIELPNCKYKAEDAVLIIPNTVTTVGDKAFFNSGIGRVNIPSSVNSIGTAAFCTGCLKNATVQQGNERYTTIDGALYDKKNKELLAFASDATGVPEGIISLGEFSCINLTYSSNYSWQFFPDTIRTINDFALWNSDWSEIAYDRIIRVWADTIGAYAFAKASLSGEWRFFNENLKEIGEGAFYQVAIYPSDEIDFSRCSELEKIPARAFAYNEMDYYWRSEGGQIVLPSSIVEIGEEAFAYAECVSWSGDAQPQIIGDRAFIGAASAALEDKYLEKVEYIGEEAFQTQRYYLEMTIPASCTFIGDNAFYSKVKLNVTPGSYAETWAQENGYEYDNGIEEDLSWLSQN